MKFEVFKTSNGNIYNSTIEGGKQCIDIETIADLLALVEKEGPVIVRHGGRHGYALQPGEDKVWEIEVYDTYRE